MQSAYNILGIPGNATLEDIELAFDRAKLFYTPQKMADDSRVAERFTEVKNAYNVLRDPASRAAHDRKLAGQNTFQNSVRNAPARPSVMVRERKAISPLLVISALALAVFAGGFWIQHKRDAAKAELAAKEAEAAKMQAIADAEKQKAEALEIAARARIQAVAAQQEQAMRREGDMAMSRLQTQQARQQSLDAQTIAAEKREAQRREYERRADEQRRVSESQRRVAADKQRIRELCYLNYRRHDC